MSEMEVKMAVAAIVQKFSPVLFDKSVVSIAVLFFQLFLTISFLTKEKERKKRKRKIYKKSLIWYR